MEEMGPDEVKAEIEAWIADPEAETFDIQGVNGERVTVTIIGEYSTDELGVFLVLVVHPNPRHAEYTYTVMQLMAGLTPEESRLVMVDDPLASEILEAWLEDDDEEEA